MAQKLQSDFLVTYFIVFMDASTSVANKWKTFGSEDIMVSIQKSLNLSLERRTVWIAVVSLDVFPFNAILCQTLTLANDVATHTIATPQTHSITAHRFSRAGMRFPLLCVQLYPTNQNKYHMGWRGLVFGTDSNQKQQEKWSLKMTLICSH